MSSSDYTKLEVTTLPRKVYQTIFTDLSKGVIGNCLAACLASLLDLDLEDLPCHSRIEQYMPFLSGICYRVHYIEGSPPEDDLHYITGYKVCSSIIGNLKIGHAVICKNGKIVHDPRDTMVKLIEPHGYYPLSKRGPLKRIPLKRASLRTRS